MSRRILILFCPFLFVASLALHAQRFPNDSFAWQDRYPLNYPAEPPWTAAKEPSPRYPITARLEVDYNYYSGYNYSGGGLIHIFNPRGEDMQFTYRCDLTFANHRPTEFYARWITPHRKLEILLQKPYGSRTRTCRVTTTPSIYSARASKP